MIEHTDLSQPIYKRLKEMIRNGELKQGEKLVQEKIADQLGVSRTPLMKALLALENEYLVESIPRKGMYLRVLNYKEIIDIYVCREALEGMAARVLANNKDNISVVKKLKACFIPFVGQNKIDEQEYAEADEKFHSLLIKLTGNAPLDNIYFFSNIHDKVVGHGLIRPPDETLEEHFEIINAIASGNADEAEKLTRAHINKSKELLINQYKNQESE
ncbi:GntR family transcriptional regulator [Jejuia pallidilutea]|jgi:DNA-binding GntR family transcriptional regulator|uniref:Transcriptional regulator n=1 Tax=Jejuia pallidilutea TaxID=504487 RepID=A0A090WSX1_9FLAO|nr:GntR family transcriptional regulator [Jejuia pallidilutea]GAL66744.1 transcriptional regulator [Jejuia pallidilutea]GAL70472.1 transcriptional regulator [Jejuia pallidilutea]GAL90535.1 transcriptional regulator [Jejuia pallidilutea]